MTFVEGHKNHMVRYIDFTEDFLSGIGVPEHPEGRYVSLDDLLFILVDSPDALAYVLRYVEGLAEGDRL